MLLSLKHLKFSGSINKFGVDERLATLTMKICKRFIAKLTSNFFNKNMNIENIAKY